MPDYEPGAPKDDLTDPGGEVYGGSCPWSHRPILADRWNDGSLHCSKCGRPTTITEGERYHAFPVASPGL